MLVRPIPKIGELAVYDTALRIGARFGLEPEKVYVHAGTRDGAHALGFDRRLAVIEMDELPVPIQQLYRTGGRGLPLPLQERTSRPGALTPSGAVSG